MRKLLVTGGSGYIGSYITKMAAATRTNTQVYVLSRQKAEDVYKKCPDLRQFKNVEIVQGDCLEKQSLPREVLKEVDGVIHCVGTLFEGGNYKSENPLQNLQIIANSFYRKTDRASPLSYESLNRDSCINLALVLNEL